MYSSYDFISVLCSLENKFKGFNEKALKKDDLAKVPENDKEFITLLNDIKKNAFDSIIKDLLDNLDFFDFIYSHKEDFMSCNDSEKSKKLYNRLKEEYDNAQQNLCTNVTIQKKLNLSIANGTELSFIHKNILFKGVPGTGKSHKIDKIVKKLGLEDKKENVLRVNIHSASSNADLMQGIAISTKDKQVSYQEKQGLILKHIQDACFSPYEPFVLILEEIQENSLNELIGDLIYLIEPSKRANIQDIEIKTFNKNEFEDKKEYDFESLVDFYLENIKKPHSVELPNLVSINENNRKMIMPDNLYILCTSNYRDDKKVIEDNLLRRFDVIEVYPQNRKEVGKNEEGEYYFKSLEVSDFLEALNDSILKVFDKTEIHPDRFLIGHSNWLTVEDGVTKEFYKSLLKVVIEFKEIREIDFSSGVKKVFADIKLNDKYKDGETEKDNWVKKAFEEIIGDLEISSYQKLVKDLQKEVYKNIFEL